MSAGQPARRTCPACGQPLTWSSFLPAARCANCRSRIGAPPYVVEVALLAGVVLLASGPRAVAELPAYVWFAAAGVALSGVDAQVRRLPNHLTVLWAGGVLIGLALPAVLDNRGDAWLRAVLGAAATAGVLGLMALPRGMGWGDVKAGLAVGAALAWVSWVALFAGIMLAFVLTMLYTAVLWVRGRTGRGARVGRGTRVVFGPFLVAAGLIVAALLP